MSKITKEISNLHTMLLNMHRDLGLVDLNPTEKFIFLKIINEIEENKTCSMLKAVEVADKSRSTVYKTIRKLVSKGILAIENSNDDKRSFLLKPLI
jgi:predicted transcriptional regulator